MSIPSVGLMLKAVGGPEPMIRRLKQLWPFDSGCRSVGDLASAMHPQTMLSYEMNGRPLQANHGSAVAPVYCDQAWLQEREIPDGNQLPTEQGC
jgi:DMSO/TMAO reductase YedYZ molybdopterin-dependent catalytic subunit